MSAEQMRECFEQSYGEPWDSVSEHARSIWETAWDASRVTLVIELPAPSVSEYATRSGYNCAVQALHLARAAIEAAGANHK